MAERFQCWDEIEGRPRYNIAPTQPVVTVLREMGKQTRKFTTMRGTYSFVGKRHEHRKSDAERAVGDRLTSTPAFRESILSKRCLIPADGFYEWRKMRSVKQPYCFEVGEGELFALAGSWDQWRVPRARSLRVVQS
jgi:putative SOS response-associated peptidase YedK